MKNKLNIFHINKLTNLKMRKLTLLSIIFTVFFYSCNSGNDKVKNTNQEEAINKTEAIADYSEKTEGWYKFRANAKNTSRIDYKTSIKRPEEFISYKTNDRISTSPSIVDGIAYFGSADKSMYAISLKDSKLLWSYETGSDIRSNPTVANNMVYFGCSDNYFYALDSKTGSLVWKFKTGDIIMSSANVDNSIVYC